MDSSAFSHNLRRNYKDKKELEIYGFEVRYAYEVADVVGIRPPKDEINTDKEKENEYVSGCPFHPELRLLTEPKNHKYPEEEDVSAFIVRSY